LPALSPRGTGRPCKMRYDRDDDMVITGKRHDIKIATAWVSTRRAASSASSSPICSAAAGPGSVAAGGDRAMLHADNCYWMPNIRIESHRLKTNTASATAYRGFGGPQGMIGIERVMDHIAFALADPAVRRMNFTAEMAAPRRRARQMPEIGRSRPRPIMMPVEDFIGTGWWPMELLASCDYPARKAEIAAWNARQPDPEARDRADAGEVRDFLHADLAQSGGALVHVYQDGSIHLNHGGTEMGQGLNQKVAQVAAEVFGVETGWSGSPRPIPARCRTPRPRRQVRGLT
jgi:xanthine dehydrogenase large subunit